MKDRVKILADMNEFNLTDDNLETIHACIADLETIHEGRDLICGDILTPNDLRRFLLGVMHQMNNVWCAANGLDRTAYKNQSVMAREILHNQMNAMAEIAKATTDTMSTKEFEQHLISAGVIDIAESDGRSDDIGDPFNCCPANIKD
jgi:hypothetical protein